MSLHNSARGLLGYLHGCRNPTRYLDFAHRSATDDGIRDKAARRREVSVIDIQLLEIWGDSESFVKGMFRGFGAVE